MLSRKRGLWRVALLALPFSFVSCYRYQARPLAPQGVERQYRSRTLADAGLKEFLQAQVEGRPPSWPANKLNLDTLTLVAFYFHPDLDVARARVAAAEASITTASTMPNPAAGGAGGYTNAERAPYVLKFSLDWTIETAGKREYRTQQAKNLTEAARFSLAETAWQVRSRVRSALLDHLLATRELELLQRELETRTEALALYEERLKAGEISRPEADIIRTSLTSLEVTRQRTVSRERETQTALETAVGLAPGALMGIQLVWDSLESPPDKEVLPLRNVQRAGLLNRLDVQRLLAEYAASENALQLEAARQYPDIHVAPGYEFAEGFNNYFIGPSSLLPVRDRNKGPIAEAEAHRSETASRFLALQTAAIDQIDRALTRYGGALADFRDADSRLKTLLESRERAIREQIQAGEADQLALIGVRLESVTAAAARLNALREAQIALGALEDAVQYPLESGVALPPVPQANPRRSQ